MSTAVTTHEALQAVPPLDQDRVRLARLLAHRVAARATLDLVLTSPRRAWTLLRHTTAGGLTRLVSVPAAPALRRLVGPFNLLRQMTSVAGLLLPVVGIALTTPPGRQLARRVFRGVGRLAGGAGAAVWRATDTTLRNFGRRGAAAADRLPAIGTALIARLVSRAADPGVRLLMDALAASLQLLGPISRGVLAHRLLGRLLPQRELRTVLEVVVVPVLLDGRVAASLRTWLDAGFRRLAGRHHNTTHVVITATGPHAAPSPVEVTPRATQDAGKAPRSAPAAAVARDNRAGRRAQQRGQAQARRARPPR